jgi:hypothetical protein
MLVFLALGWLAYVAFLLGALILVSIIWVLGNLVIWVLDLKPRPAPRNKPRLSGPKPAANPRPKVPPVRDRAKAEVTSDIWPKWTPARRQYMNRELSLWQEQFDALADS